MNPPSRLRLYWETVRHLRPVQVYGRLWFRAARPRPDLRPPPPLRAHKGNWVLPARRRQSQTGPDEFRFLNEARALSRQGWDDAETPKLWRYNLHYFDDLNAEGAAHRAQWHHALMARWITENPPGKGTGWEPYPTSLRVVNWIKWAMAGQPLAPEMVHSLAVQARFLRRRLEHHLLGNHLFANAKALLFAGRFFEGAEAQSWLDCATRLLAREVPEQILPDGGQFELSTMYHALALEDMLDLVNITRSAGAPVPALWTEKIPAMRRWLAAMCHPDGDIAFFNDAAFGIAPTPTELDAYAERLGLAFPAEPAGGAVWLRDSGYVRLQGLRAVALVDVAQVGPRYLPGHAHADTLSFELSLDGQRLLVNSGTSVYGNGPERWRQRGTAAHNTVIVEGENSSEVWSGFRVARRARPSEPAIEESGETLEVKCSHDGYRRLASHLRHKRTIRLQPQGLDVTDSLSDGGHRAEARFHVHPAWTVSAAANGADGTMTSPDGRVVAWRIETGQGRLETSSFHPEFGLSIPSACLAVGLTNGQSLVRFSW